MSQVLLQTHKNLFTLQDIYHPPTTEKILLICVFVLGLCYVNQTLSSPLPPFAERAHTHTDTRTPRQLSLEMQIFADCRLATTVLSLEPLPYQKLY